MRHGSASAAAVAGTAAVLGLFLSACGSPVSPPGTSARDTPDAGGGGVVLDGDIDLAACLAPDAPGARSCPAFAVEAAVGLREECAGVGGTLRPANEPRFWRLDVDADNQSEYLVDLTENFWCDGAPSLFSCGSLGCPYALYAEHAGAWTVIGLVNSRDAPEIEVVAASGHATLRGGCNGARPCDEMSNYEWNGTAYEQTTMDVRGHQVRVAPGGLWTVLRDVAVVAAPAEDAEVLDRYQAGLEFVVIGEAADPRYKFVSPCNACQNGFVAADALRKWENTR